jgi:hypothetical protein
MRRPMHPSYNARLQIGMTRIMALAERGAHYTHPGNEVKARERRDKWHERRPGYTTLQEHTVAKILASRTADQIFHGGASLNIAKPLYILVDETMAALSQANEPARGEPALYVRGGLLSRVHRDEHGRPSIKPIAEPGLKVEIDRVVRYTKTDAKGNRSRCHPPKDVVEGVLAAKVMPFPPLAGITEVPVLRPDGTVLAVAGYDAVTGLLYRPVAGAAAVPPVPDQPTDEQVRAAFRLLHEVLYDFPFHAPADRANALGLLITLAMRAVFTGNIPLALVDSPAPGTGKGLLKDVLALIAVGIVVGALTEVESDAEWRKQITTELMAGRSFHIIDNVEHTLSAPGLASLLTTPEWQDRLLATNKTVSIAGNQRGVWCATGNNITVGGDLPRKCYRIRLDAQMANPFLRGPERFKHYPLLEWVEQQRPAILHALLTVCRAWFARGKPTKGAPTLGSFEQWAQVVWGVLSLDPTRVVPSGEDASCYGASFLANGAEVWEQGDSNAEEWEPFLRQLFTAFPDKPFTVASVAHQVRGDFALNDLLRDALPGSLRADASKDSFTKLLGQAFKRHDGTRYGNAMWRIERDGKDDRSNTVHWRVRREDGREDKDGGHSNRAHLF